VHISQIIGPVAARPVPTPLSYTAQQYSALAGLEIPILSKFDKIKPSTTLVHISSQHIIANLTTKAVSLFSKYIMLCNAKYLARAKYRKYSMRKDSVQ